MADKLRVLHAIHDFLPRHRAGSEIYAHELCQQLRHRHHVTVLCAEYDPTRRHGSVTWREYDGLSVVEVVNNWSFDSFADTYQSRQLNQSLEHVLRAVGPDVLHIHSLLNLSFDLPTMARRLGIPSVATLHDYTLVCPSGGQRVHVAEEHTCDVIDPNRCSRCFPQSPFYAQMLFARFAGRSTNTKVLLRLASWMSHRVPRLLALARTVAAQADPVPISPADITARLEKVKEVFAAVDVFVAPSAALASEYRRFGIPDGKLRVSDYGFVRLDRVRARPRGRLQIGFVGTLVWHKGVHIVVDAVKELPSDAYELKIFGDQAVFRDYSNDLQHRSAGLPVRFMGPFHNDDRASVYAQIDVLVVSSLWPENSPLVIHEAFMAGVPVIGARVGGIPDLVTDGISGLLYDPYSSSALAKALQTLIDNPTLLDRFAARLPAVKPIEQDAREWDDVYQSVTSAERPTFAYQ